MRAETRRTNPTTGGFNKNYIRLIYSTLPPKFARHQVSFIIKKLGLKKGMSILDIGCGNGRHCLEFARRGYRATGIDSSKDLIALARKRAGREKLSVRFIQKDMTALSFSNEFDVAISVYSFGFLKKKGEHSIAMEKVARSLKNGGKLLLITGNSLQKLNEARKSFIKRGSGKLFTRTSEKTLDSGTVVKVKETINIRLMKQTIKSTWKEHGKTHTHLSTMHLFMPSEIKKMLTEHNLRVVSVTGDFDSSPFLRNSKKLLLSVIKK